MDLIAQADDQAVAAGITVVEATGDAGVTSTTGEAATDPNVISAGASTDNQNYIQDGFGGTRFPEVKSWSNDQVSSLSSGGFDQRGRTIDVVAPGESDWALCSTNQDEFGGCASLTAITSHSCVGKLPWRMWNAMNTSARNPALQKHFLSG